MFSNFFYNVFKTLFLFIFKKISRFFRLFQFFEKKKTETKKGLLFIYLFSLIHHAQRLHYTFQNNLFLRKKATMSFQACISDDFCGVPSQVNQASLLVLTKNFVEQEV
jgi:hypothetical protein